MGTKLNDNDFFAGLEGVGDAEAFKQYGGETPDLGAIPTIKNSKVMKLFFIIDTSPSMGGERITAVNNAMREVVEELKKLDASQSVASFEIAVLTFNSTAEWHCRPTPIQGYQYVPLEPQTRTLTYYGEAFRVLNEGMTRADLMRHTGPMASPYIFFLTDGQPIDSAAVYMEKLKELKSNGWFAASIRYAMLVGTDAINNTAAQEAVRDFVNNPNEGMVLEVTETSDLVKKLKAATMATVGIATRPVGGVKPSDLTDDPTGATGGSTDPVDPADPTGGSAGWPDPTGGAGKVDPVDPSTGNYVDGIDFV